MPEKIFPYLAQQVVEDYGLTEGVCLDIRSKGYFQKILAEAGIESYRLLFDDPVGRWAEICK